MDFEDPDNLGIDFVNFMHEYVTDKSYSDDELIVEYIECDR